MKKFSGLFSKKKDSMDPYERFWEWFRKKEKGFHKNIRKHSNIENDFFDKIAPELKKVKEGIFFLTGMLDERTVELILTPDGWIQNIAFVEELVDRAPEIPGWKFTALKPVINDEDPQINMSGYAFNKETLSFYSIDHEKYPDEIEIAVVHRDLNTENKKDLTIGVHIFLDNYLGELDYLTNIDRIAVIFEEEAKSELIPITKLKSYLNWRQKEFVERYDGVRRDTEHDQHSIFEGEFPNGQPMIAVINTDLLDWEGKASHPWIMKVDMKYNGQENNGLPDPKTKDLLDELENMILSELKDFDGYLNIGRQTGNEVRETYFACRDFRKPSKLLYKLQKDLKGKMAIGYEFYKDKYWLSFKRFQIPL